MKEWNDIGYGDGITNEEWLVSVLTPKVLWNLYD